MPISLHVAGSKKHFGLTSNMLTDFTLAFTPAMYTITAMILSGSNTLRSVTPRFLSSVSTLGLEARAFGLVDPDAKAVPLAVDGIADRDVDGVHADDLLV